MNIVILHEEPFPVGMACTNRILSLAKGFQENGANVRIVCMRPVDRVDRGIVNTNAKGTVNGVGYEYLAGTTIRNTRFLVRRWHIVKSFIGLCATLRNTTNRTPNDTLLIYNFHSVWFVLLFRVISRLGRFKLARDLSEHPGVIVPHRTLIQKLGAHLYLAYGFRMLDGLLVMTNPLERLLRDHVTTSTRILLVPMTVDMSRFQCLPAPSPNSIRYVTYCGYLGGNKDGVQTLVRAFAMISPRHPDVRLCIIGDAPGTDELAKLTALVSDLKIGEKVIFTGQVHRNRIPDYLCRASLLALARPTSMQADGGFPSKVGEYLATGNPVIVTRVGDIPLYLRDGENAFIAEPDSVELFAEKMDYALSNTDLARRIGTNGRSVACAYFDYRVQCARILEFLKNPGKQDHVRAKQGT